MGNVKLNSSFISILLVLIIGCSSDDSLVLFYEDGLVIDKLYVQIAIDETPGFKYPLMYHNILVKSHLTKKGNVSTYVFKCPSTNAYTATSFNYAGIPKKEAGFMFEYKRKMWTSTINEHNLKLPFTMKIQVGYPEKYQYYDISSETKVEKFNRGIQPNKNSIQITGPSIDNFSPQFSGIGDYLYYVTRGLSGSLMRCSDIGDNPMEFHIWNNSEGEIGRIKLLEKGKFAGVINDGSGKSKIFINNLASSKKELFKLEGYLSGSELVKIPNTNKFLNIRYSTGSGNYRKILMSDITSGEIINLFKGHDWYINNFSINPVTKDVYINVLENNGNKIYKYNFESGEISTFIENSKIQRLKFSPNGKDIATIKIDDNNFQNIFLTTNGVEKQLTTYPNYISDFNFSLDGRYIVFSCERRGEVQCWRIEL